MKKFYLHGIAFLTLAASFTSQASAEEWYMEGQFNNWERTFFTEKEDGSFEMYVRELRNDFYIGNESGTMSYGGSEYVKLDEIYNLVKDGSGLLFPEGVEYVEDAVVSFNPEAATLLVSGTAVTSSTSGVAYVAGSFNDWNLSDPGATLKIEAGTQIYSGRVDMSASEGETVTWRIYTSETDPENNMWGAQTTTDQTNCTEGFLVEGSQTAVSTNAGEYDFWFNSATGQFRLTPVNNTTEKSITITPAENEPRNRYTDFTITFNGYNTATLDPTMYDIYNGPGTFTNEETGEVVARAGGQPLPFAGNQVLIQLSQSIYNQEYIDVDGKPDPDEIENYKPYPNGIYRLTIPAGSIMLYDGKMTLPNEQLDFLYTLADVHDPVAVEKITNELEDSDIYSLDGRFIMKATAEGLRNLPKGIYVVRGKKYLVK